MHNRTRMIATAAAVSAAVAAGSAAAVASTTGARSDAAAKTMSASENPGGAKPAGEQQGNAAMAAAVARALHLSTARVSAALRPLFAAGRGDASSPVVAAAARSLGVSTNQLYAALVHAKLSLAGAHARQGPARSKAVGANSAAEQQSRAAMTAAVARALHVSTARVNAALRPLFAAGQADTSSPIFAAAARSLGVSTHQLDAALRHAKQSMEPGS